MLIYISPRVKERAGSTASGFRSVGKGMKPDSASALTIAVNAMLARLFLLMSGKHCARACTRQVSNWSPPSASCEPLRLKNNRPGRPVSSATCPGSARSNQ